MKRLMLGIMVFIGVLYLCPEINRAESQYDFVEYDFKTNEKKLVSFSESYMEGLPEESNPYRGRSSPSFRDIIGADDRHLVEDAKKFPYSAVARIEGFSNDGGVWRGSGALIGSDTVITNAHVTGALSKSKYPPALVVVPAYANKPSTIGGINATYEAPFGKAKVVKIYIMKKYYETEDAEFDIAVLKLDRPLGNQAGYFGMSYLDRKEDIFSLTGYHSDKNGFMYTQSDKLSETVVGESAWNKDFLLYTFDSILGSSGSPVYDSQNRIHGVHSIHWKDRSGAARISREKFSMLYQFANGWNPNDPLNNGLELDSGNSVMEKGQNKQLVASIQKNEIINENLIWSSSDEEVATVKNGTIKALKSGKTTIKVQTKNDTKSASCIITVDDHGNIPETATIVTDRSNTKGELLDDSDVDYFKFVATKTTRFFIESTKKTDVVGALLDDQNQLIKEQDDIDVKNKQFNISHELEKGKTYYIRVTGHHPGSYEIRVEEDIAVSKVSLPNPIYLEKDVFNYVATVFEPSNALNKRVSWKSSDESVAKYFSDNCWIRAGSKGTASVTITTEDGGKTATSTVIIDDHGGNAITATSVEDNSLTEGNLAYSKDKDFFKFKATKTGTYTIVSEGSTDTQGTLYDSKEQIIGYDDDGNGNAQFKLIKELEKGNEYYIGINGFKSRTGTYRLRVTAPLIHVTDITMEPQNILLEEKASQQLKASISPENATNKNIVWTSSDESIARVDSEGKIEAIKVGKAIITATTEDGKKTATSEVTVIETSIPVTEVTIEPNKIEMEEKASQQLTAKISPDNATNKKIVWKSSDESIATVSQEGKVTAHKSGSAKITVTTADGNKIATCIVQVEKKNEPFGNVPWVWDKESQTVTFKGGKFFDTDNDYTIKNRIEKQTQLEGKKIKKIIFTEPIELAKSSSNLFAHLYELETIEGADYLDTSKVTNMGYMFYYDTALSSVDVSKWNVEKAWSMSGMFWNASALKTVNVEKWKTTSLKQMDLIFSGMKQVTELNLSNWDTSAVTQNRRIFENNQALDKLVLNDTFKLYDKEEATLPEKRNLPYTGRWVKQTEGGEIEKVYETSKELLETYDGTGGTYTREKQGTIFGNVPWAWDKESQTVTFKGGKFFDTDNDYTIKNRIEKQTQLEGKKIKKIIFTEPIELAKSSSNLFAHLYELETIEGADYLDTSKVTNMGYMFYYDTALSSVDVSKWNVEKAWSMSGMFWNASALKTVNVEKWKTTSLKQMDLIFSGMKQVTELNLSNWDTSAVTQNRRIFENNQALDKLVLNDTFKLYDKEETTLPEKRNLPYTGRWVKQTEGGEIEKVYETSREFLETYDGTGGTYIRETK